MEIPRCNVFERRGVIERLEAWSEVQLNSERIAVETGPEDDPVFNIACLVPSCAQYSIHAAVSTFFNTGRYGVEYRCRTCIRCIASH